MGSPISPWKSSGAGMCHSPHMTQGAAAELGTGADPGLPFCALSTRSSNVTQLFHLLTKPLLIITSISFPSESFSSSGNCSVPGSPKCLWKRWTERCGTVGPWHRDGSSLYLVKCPAYYTSSSVKWDLRWMNTFLPQTPACHRLQAAILQLCARCSRHTHNTWKKLTPF